MKKKKKNVGCISLVQREKGKDLKKKGWMRGCELVTGVELEILASIKSQC